MKYSAYEDVKLQRMKLDQEMITRSDGKAYASQKDQESKISCLLNTF
jgi:hypothetical protein